MINSIKDLKVLNGKEVRHLMPGQSMFNEQSHDFIVDHDNDMISFKMMTEPVSEGGNGCQFTDLIEVALHQLRYLDEKFPCKENKDTMGHLELALSYQKLRTAQRLKRKVEGKNIL